jgi:NAD-dependent deacetylase
MINEDKKIDRMKITVLTGAGMSAESGLKTFRDSDGLWEGHDVMEVASPIGWNNNPELVLDFYNQRRRQLLEVKPNEAHLALADMEQVHDVTIVTQNVDDLHERAGSSKVAHLHGELFKVRSTVNDTYVIDWREDLAMGDICSDGYQLRPHIVWFGEAVPMMEEAVRVVRQSDLLMIVGTSMQVYPAAGLLSYAPYDCPVYFIDPNPSISSTDRIKVFPEKATIGVPNAIEMLSELY